ncbi:camp-independent regulatory protein pac2 [Gigaspora margarita]|uniref:Camp-independent regulatory protein pac2 n=1 Tax=Gigaspora margarita TaxID=4874 RepID=A0A8H3X2K6_GIGMA|nr:camp-independent regulatory protein pac2 [Gigaspora margarita]
METYFGFVKSPQDAILLFEACRIGFLSRIQRRLSEKERSSIRSGSVFVWDEREAGMRRWTDGKSWSASRVSGSFLTYRELESKRKSNSRGSNNPHDLSSEDTDSSESYHSVTKKSMSATEQCRYKHGGLVKQSFSITTTSHQKLHLICYYTKADVINEKLQIPSHDEKLKSIVIPKGMYPETSNVDGVAHVHHYAAAHHHQHHPHHHHHHQHTHGFGDNSGIERSISPNPYTWQLQQSHATAHQHRHSTEPMQFDTQSACSTPSISSSPSTTEDDFPNFFGRHNYLQHHASGSTSSLPVYPPSNYIQSPSENPFGNGSQPINIPNPNSRFTFPAPQLPYSASYPPQSSQANGFQLPPQDIPREKMIDRNNEDQRQLNAIYTTLKL